jgi:hypothetical protein
MTIQLNSDVLSGVVLASMMTLPDDATVRQGAQLLRIDPEIADAALATMRAGNALGIVFSGKMASGKDTIAEMLSHRLASMGLASAEIHRTSDPIRAELNLATEIITAASSEAAAIADLAGQMNLSLEVSSEIAHRLFETTRWSAPTAEQRTNLNRYLLVYLADKGRRAVDPSYWVSLCFTRVLTALANGSSALLTGGRYPNEVFPAQVMGIMATRIEVSPEVQLSRVRSRDGIEPDPELFLTENECALDSYVGFNLKVTNNALPEPTLEVVEQFAATHVHQLSK